jgi:hypothetical protein
MIAAESDNASARSLRAHALAELGRWPQAIADLEAVIALDDGDASTWYFLALARLGAGQDAKYRRVCERMLKRFSKLIKPAGDGRAPTLSLVCSRRDPAAPGRSRGAHQRPTRNVPALRRPDRAWQREVNRWPAPGIAGRSRHPQKTSG